MPESALNMQTRLTLGSFPFSSSIGSGTKAANDGNACYAQVLTCCSPIPLLDDIKKIKDCVGTRCHADPFASM